MLIMLSLSEAADLNHLAQGSQLYSAFSFSKGSLCGNPCTARQGNCSSYMSIKYKLMNGASTEVGILFSDKAVQWSEP